MHATDLEGLNPNSCRELSNNDGLDVHAEIDGHGESIDANINGELTDTQESPGDGDNGPCLAEEPETHELIIRDSPADAHKRLRKQIEAQKKQLKKRKILASDTSAAHTLIDLEALGQYNDLRLTLANKKDDIKKSIPGLPSRLRTRTRTRWASIKPATDAANSVASRCGKGPFYARTLREMAHSLAKTGELPENRQGKGGYHKSLLAMPAVSSAVQQWVKGGLPFEKGGFNGRVCENIFIYN